MKKFLLSIFLIFIFSTSSYGGDNVSFIYINGSNNNDEKMANWYENGVKKLHPVLRKKILKNRTIKKYYSQFGGLSIDEEPVIFFWGYNSKNDLEFVKSQLEISKMVSSSGAYIVRNLITQFLHDAIWVQKPHNMKPILDDLNKKVIEQSQKDNKVMLYGYSAGTFITYQYMFNKLRYIDPENLFEKLNVDEDFINFVKANPQGNTCISALSEDGSKIGTFTSNGHLIMNPNKQMLKESYLKLKEVTPKVCAPEDNFAGTINFASPLVLFYSDMSDPDYEKSYYSVLMVKYILEKGIFMMTINFREDPLGFPTNRNLTISEIERLLEIKIENPSGVIYDNSGVWSKRMFPFAHTAYWSARGTFSSAIVKSFVNAYKFQYDEKYQQKVIKRNKKSSEL